jgi:hypothetical protein
MRAVSRERDSQPLGPPRDSGQGCHELRLILRDHLGAFRPSPVPSGIHRHDRTIQPHRSADPHGSELRTLPLVCDQRGRPLLRGRPTRAVTNSLPRRALRPFVDRSGRSRDGDRIRLRLAAHCASRSRAPSLDLVHATSDGNRRAALPPLPSLLLHVVPIDTADPDGVGPSVVTCLRERVSAVSTNVPSLS